MPHRIFDSLNLLFRTPRLFTIGRLRLVIVLPLDNPMLLLHLCDIQIGDSVSILLFYPVPYGVICCTLLKSVRVHILQTEFNPQFLRLDISLGKQTNSLPGIIVAYSMLSGFSWLFLNSCTSRSSRAIWSVSRALTSVSWAICLPCSSILFVFHWSFISHSSLARHCSRIISSSVSCHTPDTAFLL